MSDRLELARRVSNAAHELAIAFHEAERIGAPSRLRERLRTVAIKASEVAARFDVVAEDSSQ